ncbi:hypothetical protein M0R89_18925 (plasmid) [Halorussus limi]|uniref:DUF7344 domain-containing protein n=1 Tax=Halorussus limi TaxID=2938695 RepID=A0A8U0I0A9_9EURY|nr:hypothetical protein [Halorussus limi]UPV76608.1 hypothetical protein M0R89_18925 [Halorussus limi]
MILVIMCSGDASSGDDGDAPSFARVLSDRDGRSIDQLFETIADRRSRLVLSYFDSASVDAAELDDLVEYVAEREVASSSVDADAADEEYCRRVAISLHHNHLPKLSDDAFVDYDPRSKTVRYWGGDRVSACLKLYEAVRDD